MYNLSPWHRNNKAREPHGTWQLEGESNSSRSPFPASLPHCLFVLPTLFFGRYFTSIHLGRRQWRMPLRPLGKLLPNQKLANPLEFHASCAFVIVLVKGRKTRSVSAACMSDSSSAHQSISSLAQRFLRNPTTNTQDITTDGVEAL